MGSALLALGVSAPLALADTTPAGGTVGGATAPVGATGPTGATGTTTTTPPGLPDTTGAYRPNVVKPPPPPAPITLGGQSPSYVYDGPVYVQTASGIVPYVPHTRAASVSGGTVAGVLSAGPPHLLVPGARAEIVHGIAAAPEEAPRIVRRIIWAANRIVGRPYVYGGGHDSSFTSFGYDCSGTVSFALHGGRLLRMPLDSSQFMSWGRAGQGRWVTILTNPGHAYLDVAGLRLDTSASGDPSNKQGPRWRPLLESNSGYATRHPVGL